MIVLDTNVISELMQPNPDPAVSHWLDGQLDRLVWTSSITLFEIQFGIAAMARGKKRERLENAFQQVIQIELEGRILSFDEHAALEAGGIAARLRALDRPIEARDTMIAGVVAAQGGELATRNVKHFEATGVPLINPWDGK